MAFRRFPQSSVMRDLLLAVLLSALLTAAWTYLDWDRLRWLTLPDADDMMRLAQVRDWLGGQATNDWTQYRLAPALGAPMHWSRINDVGIAGLILAITPTLGRHGAELVAVLLYPACLFAAAIALSARIARRLWGASAAPIAAILTALASPGTSIFVPGRIDHHALQVVLVQVTVLMLMRAPGKVAGIVAGIAMALSLLIGLEAVPQLAGLVGVLTLLWISHGAYQRERLAGFAAGLGGTTGLALLFLRPTYWNPQLCDAFTPATASATLAGAGALALLAAATPWLRGWAARLAAGALFGGVVLGTTLMVFPGCLAGPYGRMAPFLRVAFLPHIDEANSILLQRDPARMIALGGLLTVAAAAALWMAVVRRGRWPRVLPIAVVVIVSALLLLSQTRAVYIGAPLAGPVLAGLVLVARRRSRTGIVIAAWLASVGLSYQLIPALIAGKSAPAKAGGADLSPEICSAGDVWTQVDRYPPGVTMASTNMASYLIGATHMASVGASYHRNDRGNMAMYRFFLGDPARSRAIGRAWHVRYVAFCPGDFDEISVTRTFPNSLATALRDGHAPVWLQSLPLRGARLRFYRVLP